MKNWGVICAGLGVMDARGKALEVVEVGAGGRSNNNPVGDG